MQFIMALKMNLKKQKKNQTITISKALFTNGLLGERANEPFEGS